jgi:hypothetical protein
MEKHKYSLPSLKTHALWSLLTSLLCASFILTLVVRQQDYIQTRGMEIWPFFLLFSLPILTGLLSSIILWIIIWRLPAYRRHDSTSSQCPESINRLLRADAYTYLILPLMVLAIMAWEQIGNIVPLILIFWLSILCFKVIFFLEYNKLSKNCR